MKLGIPFDLRTSDELDPVAWVAHQFDGLELSDGAREAQDVLIDSLLRLRNLELQLRRHPRAPTTGPIARGTPEGDWQRSLYWLLRSFFTASSAVLSDLSTLSARAWRLLGRGDDVPTKEMSKFLIHLDGYLPADVCGPALASVRSARDFRNHYEHPQQRPPMDWRTENRATPSATYPDWRLVYFGSIAAGRRQPNGSRVIGRGGASVDWEYVSPSPARVAQGHYELVFLLGSRMSGDGSHELMADPE